MTTLIEAVNLALQHVNQGRPAEAERICRAILRSHPDQAETAMIWGLAESNRGSNPRARALFARAAALRPELADAYSNLGVLLQRSGQGRASVRAHGHALRLRPAFAEAYSNRGSARLEGSDLAGAIADFQAAVVLRPDFAQALNNLGIASRQQGRSAAAVAAHRAAIAVEPGFADAHMQLAHACREAGLLPEAKAAYAEAIRLAPARTEALSYLLYLNQVVCDWDGFDDLCRRVYEVIDRDAGITLPLATLSIDTTLEQQLRSARVFYAAAVRPASAAPASAAPAPGLPRPGRPKRGAGGRLRIGYFSADFHEHATAYLAAELFERHDRARFEVFAYSYGPDDGSPMRQRLVAGFDRFRDIRALGLDAVERLVAEDGVDILIDVKTYTKGSRLDLLSRRLAPVQATYLAYPGTMGGGFMDYIIADPVVTPLEHQPFYTERLALLPDCYQVNDRRRAVAEATPTRAECGLPETGFVFCSFNTTYKILPAMFDVWMRLLLQVPGSVLWLFEANAVAAGNLRREAGRRGVAPERLVFAPRRPLPEHLARYRLADLFVDTFPYTAHTTGSDALWVGLPVVTCQGDTFASRVGASLLRAVGLPELITRSFAEFEALALSLARDPERLAGLRRRLEESRMRVPLFDSERFTRHMEAAFETMWRIHESGEPPRAFAVPPLDGPPERPRQEKPATPTAEDEAGRRVAEAEAAGLNRAGAELFRAGDPGGAAGRFRAALDRKPDFAEAALNLGAALLAGGTPDDADAAFRRLLVIRPDSAVAAGRHATHRQTAGDLGGAIAWLRRTCRLEPQALSLVNLGTALHSDGRLAEAAAAYARVVTLQPEDAPALAMLGWTLLLAGRTTAAAAAYGRAQALDPANAAAAQGLERCALYRAMTADAGRGDLPRGLVVRGLLSGPTGYGHMARHFIDQLRRRGVPLRAMGLNGREAWEPPEGNGSAVPPPLALDAPVRATAVLNCLIPAAVEPVAGLSTLTFSMFEGLRIPPAWVRFNRWHDLVIVPTESSRAAWADSGFPEDRLRVCPLGVDAGVDPSAVRPLALAGPGGRPLAAYRTRILNISDFVPRKNIDGLLRVWLRVTKPDDDAVLVLKVGKGSPAQTAQIEALLRRSEAAAGRRLAEAAPVVLLNARLTGEQITALFAAATHYWSMSHGEGWDIPMSQAGAMGLQLIAPDHSAYRAYLDATMAELIPARPAPAFEPYSTRPWPPFHGLEWWDTDEEAAASILRRTLDGAIPRRDGVRERLCGRVSWERATDRLVEVLREVGAL